MDKRYQVFVSSTYTDLHDERQEVMQALLELDCIPAGMELFPAANEDQWTLIKKVIDDCDYYIVIVAGRYGSLGPDGLSFTEMEYRYAIDSNKPVIGFVHKDAGQLPANCCETSENGRKQLDKFCELVKQKTCRFWDSPVDLGSQVSRSIIKLIKAHPAIGWVRGDMVPDISATEEILRLRKEIEVLEAKLAASRNQAPEGTTSLAQGDDYYTINYVFMANFNDWNPEQFGGSIEATWDDIFAEVSPLLIDEATEATIIEALNKFIREYAYWEKTKEKIFKGVRLSKFRIVSDNFHTIKVQLRALGLITKSAKTRSVKDKETYWTLTPYGDTVMTRLRAIKRKVAEKQYIETLGSN